MRNYFQNTFKLNNTIIFTELKEKIDFPFSSRRNISDLTIFFSKSRRNRRQVCLKNCSIYSLISFEMTSREKSHFRKQLIAIMFVLNMFPLRTKKGSSLKFFEIFQCSRTPSRGFHNRNTQF